MAEEEKRGRGPELRAIAKRRKEYERFLLDELRVLEYESTGRSDVWVYVNHNEGALNKIETFLKRSTLQFSLMNKYMVEADEFFYATEDHSKRARYYKPYYLQFDSAPLNHDVMRKIIERRADSKETRGWFHGWLTPRKVEADISILGSLSFPVPPYQRDDVYLNISLEDESDMKAPIEIPLPDCKSLRFPKVNDESVSQKLEENECEYSSIYKCEFLNIFEYEIEVHNVGQANLINIRGLHSDERILFDVGRPCSYCMPKRGTSQCTNIDQKMHYVSMMKPTDVIISHWHFDHGGAAFKLDDEAMKKARWIVPDWTKVNKPWVNNLVGFLGRNSRILRVRNSSDCKVVTNRLGYSGISLHKGKGRSGLNNTGLILLVRDAVLPGDCDYGFWPKAVEYAYKRCDAFIVPHHGAKTKKYASLGTSKGHHGNAYISVDKANNGTYGHPSPAHMADLRKNWTCCRTDQIPNGNSSYKFEV